MALRTSIVLCVLSAVSFGQETCTPFEKAKDLIGKEGCVVGRVEKVDESKAGNLFVDFCSDKRHCAFKVFAPVESAESLGDLHALEGKVVEFRGTVKDFKGQPEIELTERTQMRLAKDQATAAVRPAEPVEESARMHNIGSKPHMPGFSHPQQTRVRIR